MALTHDFYLAPKDVKITRLVSEYVDSIKELSIGHVEIHDDLILYMSDTLNWVPSKSTPFTRRFKETGLDYYAITILDEDSAKILKDVLQGWRMIFSSAPKVFTLTGSYIESNEENDGEYEKNSFEQKEILNQLDALLSFIVEVEKLGHKIYHFGI